MPDKLLGLAPRRKRLGLSQEELARQVGVTRANVANWETGFAWPKARLLPLIAGALCCSVDELYRAPGIDKTEEAATDGEP